MSEQTTDLPDRADLRNEMSNVPLFFFIFLTLLAFGGGIYLYFFQKDPETGMMLFYAGIAFAAFTLIYRFIALKIAKSKRM